MTWLFAAMAAIVAYGRSISAFLSIPAVAGFVTTLFGGLLTFVVKFVTLWFAWRSIKIGLALGIFVIFYSGIEALVEAAYVGVPEFVTAAISWVLPSNTGALITTIATAMTMRWVLDLKIWSINQY